MKCSSSYIGKTGRSLKKRLVEHKAAVRRGTQTMELQCMHGSINTRWTGRTLASVLKQEPAYWKRRVLEAIEIQKHDTSTMG